MIVTGTASIWRCAEHREYGRAARVQGDPAGGRSGIGCVRGHVFGVASRERPGRRRTRHDDYADRHDQILKSVSSSRRTGLGRKLKLKAADGFRAWRLSRGPGWHAARPRGRHPGNFRRETITSDRSAIGWRSAGYIALAPQVFDRVENVISRAAIRTAKSRTRAPSSPNTRLGEGDGRIRKRRSDALKRGGSVAITGLLPRRQRQLYPPRRRSRGLRRRCATTADRSSSTSTKKPRCPVQMHFGALDTHIPLSDVETMKERAAAGGDLCLTSTRATAFTATNAAATTSRRSRIPHGSGTLGFLKREGSISDLAEEMTEEITAPTPTKTDCEARRSGQESAKKKSKKIRRAPRRRKIPRPTAKAKAAKRSRQRRRKKRRPRKRNRRSDADTWRQLIFPLMAEPPPKTGPREAAARMTQPSTTA